MSFVALSSRIDDLGFVVTNEEEVVLAMTQHLESAIRRRTAAGQGVAGQLPIAKDTGRSYQRSGSLLGAIGSRMRVRRGAPEGVVRPLGPRPREERGVIRRRKTSAAERTSALRTRALAALERVEGRGQRLRDGLTLDERREFRAGLSLSLNRLKVGRLRRRTVIGQGSLAAILSVPPNDPNGIAGGRGVYRVFLARPDELGAMGRVAGQRMRVSLRKGPSPAE